MQRYGFIDIHTHKFYADGTIFIFSRNLGIDPEPPAEVLFSAGLHPWRAAIEDLDTALQYLETAPLAAIGEIGLDYAADVKKDVQFRVFKQQLAIAKTRNLPVVIHCVRAFNDIIVQLKLQGLNAAIFHGFTGSPEQAAEAVKNGHYLSFGERSLASPKTVESLRQVPLSAIFAETDDTPGCVSTVYEKIASIKNIPVSELQAAITENFNRIFR